MSLERPPRTISPSDFFHTWLPQTYAQLKATTSKTPPDGTVSVVLEGDSGGAWSIRARSGELSVTDGAADDALLTLTQSVDDWRSLVVGEEGDGPRIVPPGSELSTDMLIIDQGTHQILSAVKGTLRFEVPNYRGRTFAVTAAFNNAAQPAATVSVDADTLAAMQNGSMQATEAFFGGKIQMSGDTAFAMQLGMSLMQRMQS